MIETLNNQETIKSFNAAGRMQTLWEKPLVLLAQYSSKITFYWWLTVGNLRWMGTTNSRRCDYPGWSLSYCRWKVEPRCTLIACYLLSAVPLAPIAQIAGVY